MVNRGLSIIGELLIETSEEVLGVVNRILSDNYRLPGLDRMLLPAAWEVRDSTHSEILPSEVLVPFELK